MGSHFQDEAGRLETLHQYGILDTAPEDALNDLTALASEVCGTPIATISLVDENRQWFKASVGLQNTESRREHAFCAHALGQRELFVVPDATLDHRFASNPLVTGHPNIRFYAGAPLVTADNAVLGTLCVIDRTPRELTATQTRMLHFLGRQVVAHFEMHRQAAALRLSEAQFAGAFDHAPIGVALVSLTGRWLKVNQAVCTMVGYSADELTKLNFQDLTHSEDLETDLAHVRDLINGKITSYHLEKRYYNKDGRIVWVNLHVSLARNREGKPLHFISQIQDITEAREALAKQQELTQKAQAAERAKSDFLATMSHEIRTPLNGVIGMANILADTELNDMQRECVETINTSGESLLAVINDILDYSKIEAGRLEMERRPFNLQQCVEEAVDLFATQIRAKNLDATYLVAPEIPSRLVGDTLRLRQVLVNLIGNAIKFTAKGDIDVRVELTKEDAEGCHLLFSVKDSGIGIPQDKIDKLFQAFQQVDTSTTRRYGGSGLGLAICKRLTGMMNGKIWAQSKDGEGSTFSFSVVLETAPEGESPKVPQADQPLRNRSVLFVDDHIKICDVLARHLSSWGAKVSTCSSAAEALELLASRKFDAGVIDLHMPGVDGIALARQIRALHGLGMPLILMSSTGEPLEGDSAALFQSQILKPVKQSSLHKTLLKVMGLEASTTNHKAEKKLDSGLGVRHPLSILLAEDNVVNQKVGLLMLSRLGYTADAAANGKLALQALKKKTYDVILMDIQMPEMNGIEAATVVHETYGDKSPVIVALTAEALEGDEQRFLELGFDYYLSKPLQAAALQGILEAIKPSPLEIEAQVAVTK